MPPADPAAAMRKAISENNAVKIQRLLDSGLSPNIEVHKTYKTPALTYAVLYGNEAAVQKLITAGADLNKQDKNGETPLLMSYQHPNVSTILLDAGANVNIANRRGESPLMRFIAESNPNVFRLINEGANLHHQNVSGDTTIGIAVQSSRGDNKLSIIRKLIREGVDLNKHSILNHTPVVTAALHGSIETAFELIRAGADRRELMRIIQETQRLANNNNNNYNSNNMSRIDPDVLSPNVLAAILTELEQGPPGPPENRVIPRGTTNAITMEEIQNGNAIIDFIRANVNPNDPSRPLYESDKGNYYKANTVDQLASNPLTREPIRGRRTFIARIAAEGGRRRRKTKRTHRRQSTRKAH